MVYQFALGLLSLHSAGIIHRDIKGANVLVREDGTVAIADFGLSRSTESLLTQYSNVGRFVGTLNWMSPEQRFSPRKVTVQSDVWSFGMTVWQLVARDIPYREYCQEEIEVAIRTEDDRPGRPEELSKDYEALWTLITWCWKLNPFERPKAHDIVDFLEDRFRQELISLSKARKWRGVSSAETMSSEICLELLHQTDNQHAPSNTLKAQETTKPEMVPTKTTKDSSNPSEKNVETKLPTKVSELAKAIQKSPTNPSNAATEKTMNDTDLTQKAYYSRSNVMKNSSDNFKLMAKKSQPQQSISSKPRIWKRMTAVFNPSKPVTTKESSPDMSTLSTTSQSSDEVPMIDLAMVRIDARAVSLEYIIGSGALSVVWRGTFDQEIVVARKLRSNSPSSSEVKSFIRSIQLMSRLDSPYVVKFIGAAWNQPSDLMCVTEWMDGGDLRDKLSKTTITSFPWRAKVDIIYQVVQALMYVHSQGVIHRDIKSRNILLDSLKPAKLINVGTLGDYIQASVVSGAGTFRWMAPEVIMNQTYTDAADIYSLGIVLSEIDSHQLPYHDRVNDSGQQLVDTAIILKVASGSFKPTFTDQCPEWIHSMAMKCLSFNPTDRPSATELMHTLEKAMSRNDDA
ncbi:hypothetical protein AC1031_011039 [Aphanomyces cochlioides]|nr:hypothetical protein AC1031_011039 [Aphanomyces cochlioides]